MTFGDFCLNFPFFTIILGLVGAVVCIFLRGKAARTTVALLEGVKVLLNAAALVAVRRTEEGFAVYRLGPTGASAAAVNQLRFSSFECLMALSFSCVICLSVIGGSRFVRQDVEKGKRNLYYILISLLSAAMMALTYTNDLFTGYVFLEILTLTSCGVLLIRELGRTTAAAVRYMIVNLLGSGLFLMGVIVLYGQTGNLLMESIREVIDGMEETPLPLYTATALITAGLAIKSGMFPFHFWMPDTYGFATPTSSAVLSGVVSKGYIVLLLKVLVRVIGPGNPAVRRIGWLLFAAGLCGIVFGSVAAIRQSKLNKMLAFSSAAQIGYIYTGIGMGCIAGDPDAAAMCFAAATFHILMHAFTKPLLFLCSARLIEASGNSSVFRRLRGAGKRARLAAVGFTAGALSMVGVPGFAGFVSKVVFSVAAVRSGGLLLVILVPAALALSTFLNVLYFLRTIITLYSEGEPDAVPEWEHTESARTEKSLLFSAAVFTLQNILLGCASGAVVDLLLAAFGGGLV